MSIIPPAVLTVAQLVTGLVSSAKTVRELATDTSNHELKAAISDLYDDVLRVKERVADLDEENRALRVALDEKGKYVGPVVPHGYYFQTGDNEHPLCPRCFQEKPQRIAFMTESENWNNGVRRTCKLCGHHIYEKPMVLNNIGRSQTGGGPWS
jgi:hypothetical protein